MRARHIARVVLADHDRDRLCIAVLNVIRAKGPVRAGTIEMDAAVLAIIGELPKGKAAHRYVDSALQRLKRCGDAWHQAGGWVAQ